MLLNSKLLASLTLKKVHLKINHLFTKKKWMKKKDSHLTKEEFEDEKLQDADEDE